MAPARPLTIVAAALVTLVTALVACGDQSGAASVTLRVFAAASLTEALKKHAAAYERDHSRVQVTFNFGASSALAQQIVDGNAFDVFMSADEETMAKVDRAGAVRRPRIVARNRLALLVERGNPLNIAGLADLDKPGVVLVTCASTVPCGRLADAALARAGVHAEAASREANVKAVVTKVVLGEADAGIVYESDVVASARDADAVAIDGAGDPALIAVYPAAVARNAANPGEASAWVNSLLAREGQARLVQAGFLRP